jgi:hypothetical protein
MSIQLARRLFFWWSFSGHLKDTTARKRWVTSEVPIGKDCGRCPSTALIAFVETECFVTPREDLSLMRWPFGQTLSRPSDLNDVRAVPPHVF